MSFVCFGGVVRHSCLGWLGPESDPRFASYPSPLLMACSEKRSLLLSYPALFAAPVSPQSNRCCWIARCWSGTRSRICPALWMRISAPTTTSQAATVSLLAGLIFRSVLVCCVLESPCASWSVNRVFVDFRGLFWAQILNVFQRFGSIVVICNRDLKLISSLP